MDRISRSPSWRTLVRHVSIAAAIAVGAGHAVWTAAGPRFYRDDPMRVDDDMALDASKAAPLEDSNGYDFVINTFAKPGQRVDVRAGNVNTIDEVPDSSWFTNRIGQRPMSREEIVRGPDRQAQISLDGWVVSGGKSTGAQAGFRMTDPSGHLYQVEFDPPSNPEMATGAEVIGTAFYHAFGYHTVEVYLAELDPAKLTISDSASISDPLIGRRRTMTRRDVQDVLRRAARLPNGNYRVLASRFADGAPLGNFRYYGTRPDDPNDIVPHEHRRELRGARVFGAWLNHDDSRGVNSLDMLTTDGARRYVKHYMFDFGSILGSGTYHAQFHRAGNEYILEWAPGWATLATLGLYTRPWLHIDYPDMPPAVGRFESKAFDPLRWKPEYPNPAFENMRGDDALWAARIVARFDEPAIRAVVEKARYTDPAATDYIVAALVERRAKVLRAWLAGTNPVADLALAADGTLTFENAAEQAGVASAPGAYTVKWARFDNATGQATPAGSEQQVTARRAQAPAELLAPGNAFIEVQISAVHAEHPRWATPATAHFRRVASGWELVGLTR